MFIITVFKEKNKIQSQWYYFLEYFKNNLCILNISSHKFGICDRLVMNPFLMEYSTSGRDLMVVIKMNIQIYKCFLLGL